MKRVINLAWVTAAIYPCDSCGLLRTKEQGGTVFTVCDDCWAHGGTATYDARTSALAANLSAAALEELRVRAAVARSVVEQDKPR